jgi:hypothetical protein
MKKIYALMMRMKACVAALFAQTANQAGNAEVRYN